MATITFAPMTLGAPSLNATQMRLLHWLDLGPPTLQRPFGLRLWPIFDAAFANAVDYKREDFKLIIGETPLSTFKSVVAVLSSYYAIVLCGPILLRNRIPWKLQALFRLYNLLLVFSSATLCLLFLEQIIPTIARHGLLFSICELEGGFTDELVLLYYVRIATASLRPFANKMLDQLSHEVSRAARHRVFDSEEEAS